MLWFVVSSVECIVKEIEELLFSFFKGGSYYKATNKTFSSKVKRSRAFSFLAVHYLKFWFSSLPEEHLLAGLKRNCHCVPLTKTSHLKRSKNFSQKNQLRWRVSNFVSLISHPIPSREVSAVT